MIKQGRLWDHSSAAQTEPAPLSRRAVVSSMVAGLASATTLADAGTAQAMVSADVHVSTYPTVRAATWFGEFLNGQSNGRLSLRVMHSGQLGRENDTVDLVRYGVIDVARVNVAAVANAIPESSVFALPHLFHSMEHIQRVMDAETGAQVLAAMRKRGLLGLAWYDAGPRCFYNTRHPIYTPDDMRGLKLRVPVADVFIDLVNTLHGNPTPLGYGDTYASLQTHLIDGAENNWPAYRSSRHFEVAHYWSQTEHSYSPDLLIMSAAKFDRLTPADQQLVLQGARESVTHMREFWRQTQSEARAAVTQGGVQINEVDRAAFGRAAEPVIARYAKLPGLRPLIEAAQAMA